MYVVRSMVFITSFFFGGFVILGFLFSCSGGLLKSAVMANPRCPLRDTCAFWKALSIVFNVSSIYATLQSCCKDARL